jgi:hypothetical protein
LGGAVDPRDYGNLWRVDGRVHRRINGSTGGGLAGAVVQVGLAAGDGEMVFGVVGVGGHGLDVSRREEFTGSKKRSCEGEECAARGKEGCFCYGKILRGSESEDDAEKSKTAPLKTEGCGTPDGISLVIFVSATRLVIFVSATRREWN